MSKIKDLWNGPEYTDNPPNDDPRCMAECTPEEQQEWVEYVDQTSDIWRHEKDEHN